MWRADNKDDADGYLSDLDIDPTHRDPTHAERQVTAPHSLGIGDSGHRDGNVAEPVWGMWRHELSQVGGRSPLLHFVDSPRTRIELSSTHPGGLARFITGKSTLLSSLIRDDLALRAASVAAAEITTKGIELATTRGIDSVSLGIGLASWQQESVQYAAPILLRPLAIRRYGRDFELRLLGTARLNPELATALREQFSIELDAAAFAALAESDGSFKPNPVIDRLRGLTSHLEWFNVQPRLVASTFADVSARLLADAENLDHPILDALAGNANARYAVEEAWAPVKPQHQDLRSPETDILLLDADSEQENVVAQIAAGNSVVVTTLPGTGGTQTIINAVGSLVAQNKRVLVVGPRRSSLASISSRLEAIGLTGFAVSPSTLRRDLIRSISRNEKARQPQVGEVDDALVRLRKVLLDYRVAMAKKDPALTASVLDCLGELSRLALMPDAPSTTVRLSRRSVEALANERDRAADAMVQAARLGEFKYGPGDSPWYGATFITSEEAGNAHRLAQRLSETELPQLLERANEVVGATQMRPFDNVSQLGVYLKLLVDIRDTLDKFLPVVFDRSLSELVSATASRRDSPEMSGANRRRLKKLAREYVRPGVHISDMHDNLKRIQTQRLMWQRYVAVGTPPEIPVGIADLQVTYQHVAQDLASLDRPLNTSRPEDELVNLPIDVLRERLAELSEESDVLHNLKERTEIRQMLHALELDPLIADLASRHVPVDLVAPELELAWWQSALESLLAADRALLNANTSVLDRLEADFRLVDEAHAAASAAILGWQLAENWSIGLIDWPGEAAALKDALRRRSITADILQVQAPHLSRAVAPVWLASPYEVDAITDAMPFDTVIIVDAGAITLAEGIGAIRRAKQTVAFGDPVTQTPAAFSVAVADDFDRPPQPGEDDLQQLHSDSALATLGTLLPTLSLTRSYRAGGEDLAELVNRRFYSGRIQSLPWAGSFLGHPSLRLDFVPDGHGMPDTDSGAVESVDAEVARVVELVIEHAASRPSESLMVITASAKHAVRVYQAVLTAVAQRTELNDFILGDRPEAFTVMTIDQAVAESRDRVIFSIGYGRTPHGRVLSDFGPLGQPGGERLLAVAMTRARRSMAIVTCFTSDDIDDSRMNHGAIALADILADAASNAITEPTSADHDPMLVDLARRLRSRGLRVALGHRGKLGLVAANGGMCLTIETDSSITRSPMPSLRESLRLRPEMLRRLGWHYLRVHAFELFKDPDAVADRIATMLGVTSSPDTQPIAIVGAR
ncbi:AAA family ATPase [Marisediminicola senii]|uniref:AAA family ATPase n=1 Tax=Marisediminicola senii TaxID=2711233 RepID=UPI0013EA6D4B|nr:AAA family ATPase [Marisediminicola senii]